MYCQLNVNLGGVIMMVIEALMVMSLTLSSDHSVAMLSAQVII